MTPELITTLLQIGLKYGPGAVSSIIDLLRKPDPSLADIDRVFAELKTYDERLAEANVRIGRRPDAPISFIDSPTPPRGS